MTSAGSFLTGLVVPEAALSAYPQFRPCSYFIQDGGECTWYPTRVQHGPSLQEYSRIQELAML